MPSRAFRIALAAVVLLGGAGFAGWWFLIRDDAPPAASLSALSEPTTVVATTAAVSTTVASTASTTGAATTVASAVTTVGATAGPDGTWTLKPGENVFGGYRIEELFGGDTLKKTAVGRSPGVSGSLTVAGSSITAASVVVDTTKLASDSSRRDGFIKGKALESDTFPTATFTLTTPIDLGSTPVQGQEVKATATGDLTLHGVTKSITIDLASKWTGATVDVAGNAPIVLSDYGIEPPNIGGFVKVDDNGTLELQLQFTKG